MTQLERWQFAKLKKRFFDKVDKRGKDECWNWTASTRNSGYGRIGYNGKVVSAHRLSWIIHNGPIPEGKWILHKCDNKLCVNPNHLYAGTPGDNNYDTAKRTSPKSGRISRFSLEDIQEIKRLYSNRITQKIISEKFGCSRVHITHIVNEKGFLGVNLKPS